MIIVDHLTKIYRTNSGKKCVLDDVSCVFERGRSVGILGANGAGKSTLIRIVGGIEEPTRGRVFRQSRVSWPLAFSGSFHPSLSGAENVKFACRIYGVEYKPVLEYVENFAELGEDLFEHTRTYSSGMRSRLAFGLSLALAFDFYLVDEATAVGDARFAEKCREEMKVRLKTSDVIMVSHSAENLQKYCTHAAILSNAQLGPVQKLDAALKQYYKQTLGI